MGDGASLDELTKLVIAFRDARDWKQFHTPKDVAISLALEAAEIMELVQWKSGAPDQARLAEELSDVLYWVLLMAHDAKINLSAAFLKKIVQNQAKYPLEKAKGSAKKYSEL